MARKSYGLHATPVDANAYPDDGTSPDGTTEWNEALDKEGMLGFSPKSGATTKTIARDKRIILKSLKKRIKDSIINPGFT